MKKKSFTIMSFVICFFLASCSAQQGSSRSDNAKLKPVISIEEGLENQTVDFALTADCNSYTITLRGEASSPITGMSYTINDDLPAEYTDGMKCDISPEMAVGDIKTVLICASNDYGTVSKTYYFRKASAPAVTKPGMQYVSGDGSTAFSIYSPDSKDVKLYIDGVENKCERRIDVNGYSHIYSCTVQGNRHLSRYYFTVDGVKVRDPYAVMIDALSGDNICIDMTKTAPAAAWGNRPVLSEREDAIIYNLHVQDFTASDNSGVTAKGSYLGLVEAGTAYNGAKTGLDHLRELGVTHVQLMPFADFADQSHSWGNDTVNYTIPEEQYSQYAASQYVERINEVKTMINSLHKYNIRVIMEVSCSSIMNAFMFNPDKKKYYDSKAKPYKAGKIDCNENMMYLFLRDTLNFWVSEYHVDGFCLNRAGVLKYDIVVKLSKYINDANPAATLLVYGEPWSDDADDATSKKYLRPGKLPALYDNNMHFGAYTVLYRKSLFGDSSGTLMGYIFNQDSVDGIMTEILYGSRGSLVSPVSTKVLSDDWSYFCSYDPEQSINYISNYEGLCLWDKIKKCGFNCDTGKEINRLAAGIILTSQGVPMLHSGDEFLRTKVVDDGWDAAVNSNNADENVNGINWQLKIDNAATFAYYCDMIALRKLNTNFRLNTTSEISANVSTIALCPMADNQTYKMVMTYISGNPNSSVWKNTAVIYNSDSVQQQVILPGTGSWYRIANKNGKCASVTTYTAGVYYQADPRSVTVFYQ